MPALAPDQLRAYVTRIFEAAHVPADDAAAVAAHLVEANQYGHDSHGVIRVERYVSDIADGTVRLGAPIVVDRESETTAVVDGGWNFGPVIAHRCTEIAIAKARATGVGIVVSHQCGHVGRLGAYAEQALEAGMIGIAMVNNHGGSLVMSPPGGVQRRLSPNPIAVGIPTQDPDAPFLLDMTTSVVAEGKIRVARNAKKPLGEGWAVDGAGNPTTDAEVYYGTPSGSILPMGGESNYKGFGLAMMVEALAGALSPAGTSRANGRRGGNGLFVMAIDISHFREPGEFEASFGGLVEWVQSPPFAPGVSHITVPGEPERNARQARATEIPIDDETWRQLTGAAASVGVPPLEL
ncbi:MAG: Ldh family oxidoreductase [Chloroflexi bacterium]|nr:MAG: Ldh family oxidoreductase [Chloroflexota bacterium]